MTKNAQKYNEWLEVNLPLAASLENGKAEVQALVSRVEEARDAGAVGKKERADAIRKAASALLFDGPSLKERKEISTSVRDLI